MKNTVLVTLVSGLIGATVLVGPANGSARQQLLVRGVSVYGMNDEEGFPVVVRDSVDQYGELAGTSGYITIQFDVLAQAPPQLKIRFLHCNRNWYPYESRLIQDENHNTSFYLDYRASPGGVEHYAYRYVNRFPDPDGVVRFKYSGNWIFRIMDKDEKTIHAEGRFFVVDRVTPTEVSVTNDYLADNVSPLNQIHRIDVKVTLPDEVEGYFYTTVDLYQNRRFFHPYRIDANDRNPYTRVEGYNTGYRYFTIRDVFPGNEYRVLDLGNPNRYPNRQEVRLHEGVDQARFLFRAGADRNGVATTKRFTGMNSDYLRVIFRFDPGDVARFLGSDNSREVYVVGPFNQWNPSQDDLLVYDERERAYVNGKLLRRGIHDYQYVAGVWDPSTGTVLEQDWLVLEGNDWRTTNTYTAIVYYHDPRYGGFDRITGFGQNVETSVLKGSQ